MTVTKLIAARLAVSLSQILAHRQSHDSKTTSLIQISDVIRSTKLIIT